MLTVVQCSLLRSNVVLAMRRECLWHLREGCCASMHSAARADLHQVAEPVVCAEVLVNKFHAVAPASCVAFGSDCMVLYETAPRLTVITSASRKLYSSLSAAL